MTAANMIAGRREVRDMSLAQWRPGHELSDIIFFELLNMG